MRSRIKITLILSFNFIILSSATPQTSKRSTNEFCYPGQPCYPRAQDLASFNDTIGGRLHAERPIDTVCYASDPQYDASLCADVTANQNSGIWRISHFPSYQYTNWEGCGVENCTSPSADGVCNQGRIADYAVYAQTEDDIVKYVQFVLQYRLRPVVKNTGHDMLGRSSAKGGFAMWTHNMKNITYHKQFTPRGCADSDAMFEGAMTLAAGVQWTEAYEFAHEHQRYIVGGSSRTVGAAGGYVLGGGHSLLSPSLGLAADNVIQMNIVSASGSLLTLSKCSYPDLFWAVRGGGGGTWGVTTSVTYRTYPESQLYLFTPPELGANLTELAFKDMLTVWTSLAPTLAHLGVGGLWTLSNQSVDILNVIPASMVSDWAEFVDVYEPFMSWLGQEGLLGSGDQERSVFTNYTSWWDLYTTRLSPEEDGPAGFPGSTGSWIIPESYHHSDPEGIVDILVNTKTAGPVVVGLVGPIKFGQDNMQANQTSLNPVWYKSIWHVISLKVGEKLRTFAPDGAAYFGESAVYESKPAEAYWGVNYPTLAEIKRKYDPTSLFQVWHGVGSSTLETDSEVGPGWECYIAEA